MTTLVLNSPRRIRYATVLPMVIVIVFCWALFLSVSGHGSPQSFAVMWLTMSVGMMSISVFRPMLRAADGKPTRAWLFLVSFIGIWWAVGLPAYFIMNAITWSPFLIAAAWLVAGVYQLSPIVRRFASGCGSVRFTGSVWMYGARQGVRCVASCGVLMVALMLTTMVAGTLWLTAIAMMLATIFICWEKQPGVRPRAVAAWGVAMIIAASVWMVMGIGDAHEHDQMSSTVSTS